MLTASLPPKQLVRKVLSSSPPSPLLPRHQLKARFERYGRGGNGTRAAESLQDEIEVPVIKKPRIRRFLSHRKGPKPNNNQAKKTTAQAPRPDISKARKVSPNLDYSKVVRTKIPKGMLAPFSTQLQIRPASQRCQQMPAS
ncbi:hypothetical protein TNCV_3452111 [Trichonephila clavipes]|nr:hypothetical protein TNCV_3452111 [Trichonephila clavipes]